MDILGTIAGIFKPAVDLVDKVSTTDEERLQLRNELAKIENEMIKMQSSVIKAEAQSRNKLASSWRPMLMYVFMTLIVFNYIIIPLINLFGAAVQPLPVPDAMWSLIKLSLTGYVGFRSVEKIFKK